MLLIDVIVIYLACGTPFAVAGLVKREAPFNPRHVLTSVGTVLYWPLLLPGRIRYFSRRKRSGADNADGARRNVDEAQLRSLLEIEWSRAFGADDIKAFRETIQRYTALSRELSSASIRRGSELAAIVGHPDPDLNGMCLDRRNRQRLELHRTNARTELIGTIDDLVAAGRTEALGIARDLIEAVGDHSGSNEIETFVTTAKAGAAAA